MPDAERAAPAPVSEPASAPARRSRNGGAWWPRGWHLRPLDSLRARVVVPFTLAFAAVVIVASVGIYITARRLAERDIGALLHITAEGIRRQVGTGLGGEPLANFTQSRAALHEDNLVLSVVDASGRPLKHTGAAPAWPDLSGPGWRTVHVPVGSETVVIGYPWRQVEQGLHTRALELAAFAVFVIVVVAVGSWVMVGRTLSPIATLSRQADAASVESLTVCLTPPSRDAEIVQLVQTLNGLLRRLAETAEARGRFYAAASHELRTPLQALLGHIEVALSKERDRAGYRTALEEVREQTERLTNLVRDLLLLNQLQNRTSRPPRDEVDLVSMCDGLLCGMDEQVEAKGLHLSEEMPEEALVMAPPGHAEVLARNILENAVKYAAPGGILRVRLRPERAGWTLEVFNECHLAEPLDTERIFEPFYRPDGSRHSATGGNGLGLAICRAIADLNGWDVRLAQDAAGVTATVHVA